MPCARMDNKLLFLILGLAEGSAIVPTIEGNIDDLVMSSAMESRMQTANVGPQELQ